MYRVRSEPSRPRLSLCCRRNRPRESSVETPFLRILSDRILTLHLKIIDTTHSSQNRTTLGGLPSHWVEPQESGLSGPRSHKWVEWQENQLLTKVPVIVTTKVGRETCLLIRGFRSCCRSSSLSVHTCHSSELILSPVLYPLYECQSQVLRSSVK